MVLMLVGIGTLGMITESIATYFISGRDTDNSDPEVEHVRARLADWRTLDVDERRRLVAVLDALVETDHRDLRELQEQR